MPAEPVVLPLPAELPREAAESLRATLLGHPRGATVVLDCSRVPALDALGAARLLRVIAEARAAGIGVKLARMPEALRRVLVDVDPAVLETEPPPPSRHPLEVIGEKSIEIADASRHIAGIAAETAGSLTRPFGPHGIKWDRTIQQMALVGFDAVPIVTFMAFLIGVVLALNGAAQLRQFGATIFVANLVGIAMTREMAPLITAIIVAGRTGSAITAEIGAMTLSEEIDALKTMALSPTRFLVVPKVLALLLAMPLLTAIANVAGIGGGYVVGVFGLDLGSTAYLSQTAQALFIRDVVVGLIKSGVFAAIIGLVGVYRGFSVQGGWEAVGKAITRTVVTSIILCIMANACFTAFFYATGK
jgi:phospholipid/cholesterol/gamma-HCH transport system permease protein